MRKYSVDGDSCERRCNLFINHTIISWTSVEATHLPINFAMLIQGLKAISRHPLPLDRTQSVRTTILTSDVIECNNFFSMNHQRPQSTQTIQFRSVLFLFLFLPFQMLFSQWAINGYCRIRRTIHPIHCPGGRQQYPGCVG